MKILNKIKNKLIKLRVELKKETVAEKINRDELMNSIKKLSCDTSGEKSIWDKYRHRLQLYILGNDPRNFLGWDPIIGSMLYPGDKSELNYLAEHNRDMWLPAIQETWVGNPPSYAQYKKSSGNFIHTAYNLSRLLDHYKIDIKKIKKIIEFGAGYGAMAKLAHSLGFKGKYIIFDTPEFLALQKYYLKSSDTNGDFTFFDRVENIENANPDILIATWSLSESPLEIRNEFLKKIGEPSYVLIAYQENFESVDNAKYFQEYREKNLDYDWVETQIVHLPKNYYLIGKKK